MARYELIENPYGIMHTGGVVRVVTHRTKDGKVRVGDRTHVYDSKHGGTLCGAGRANRGKGAEIPGAILRGTGGPRKLADKVAKKEVDCLRCIKILYGDPAHGGDRSRIIGRSFRASAPGKRDGHNMIIGGRAGANIGRVKRPSRADKAAMLALGYSEDEITEFGPQKIADFRRGSDRHPTQTRYAEKRRPVAAPVRPPREESAKEARAKMAMRLWRAGRADSLKEAYALYDDMVAGTAMGMMVANPRKVRRNEKPWAKAKVRKNGAVSFKTKDGRTVSFKTKKNTEGTTDYVLFALLASLGLPRSADLPSPDEEKYNKKFETSTAYWYRPEGVYSYDRHGHYWFFKPAKQPEVASGPRRRLRGYEDDV